MNRKHVVTDSNASSVLKELRGKLIATRLEQHSLARRYRNTLLDIIDLKAKYPDADKELACGSMCPPASMDEPRCKACPIEF